jgi:L-histidine N-alpha-methyltransferase
MRTKTTVNSRFELVSLAQTSDLSDFGDEVREGLVGQPKRLPCRYFYDERGSLLFEEICDLPEYYLTRTEHGILEQSADEIAALLPAQTTMVELGSGSSTKTRLLIEAFLRRHGKLHYVPLDISPTILQSSALDLLERYEALKIMAIAAEYDDGLRHLPRAGDAPRLILFLGSTIGNFRPQEAREFLSNLRQTMGPNDRLLLGADLDKSPDVLCPAYDDAAGVTAAFNMNLLERINRELGGNFKLENFEHTARWNGDEHRVEMHLVSTCAQQIHIEALDLNVDFALGESIHTENSHKHSRSMLEDLCTQSGLRHAEQWTDEGGLMILALLAPI